MAILVGAAPFTLPALLHASAPGTQIALAPEAQARLAAARAVVEHHAAGDTPIYGLNTGLGGNLAYRLSPAEMAGFQTQVIRGRTIGMGAPLAQPVCRMALLCRVIGLAQGGSGLSPAVLDLLVSMFNRGITPVIPGRGSIGASDLGLCAAIAAVAIGRGQAWCGGALLPGAEALSQAGLQPAILGAKDGLALLNGNAITSAQGAATLAELANLLLAMLATAALSAEGYGANPSIFDARLSAARPAAFQAQAAALFRRLLHGSHLHQPGAARAIQDALCFRVLAPVAGTAIAAFATAQDALETELNAASDNPLVLPSDGVILSTPNFHTPAVALAFDSLAIVLCHLATASAHRTSKLMNPALSGLPRYLSPIGGGSTGLNSLQKTMACLHAEIRLHAAPASLDSLPVSDGVEDHAPQTPLTIRKLESQVQALRMLTAIEALSAAQAVDLRGEAARLGQGSAPLYRRIRAVVPGLDEDRETGLDADAVTDALLDPGLQADLRACLAGLGLPSLLSEGAAT